LSCCKRRITTIAQKNKLIADGLILAIFLINLIKIANVKIIEAIEST
jgi:hypothetical protein